MSVIDRYYPSDIQNIWSDYHKYKVWLDIEVTVCKVRGELGQIPPADLRVILNSADFDLDRIKEIEAEVHHDVIAFLSSVAEKVGPPSRHIHYGLTSSDILDTAIAILLKQSLKLILDDLDKLIAEVKKKALAYKHTPMMGRTHGVHAEPITVGIKFLSFFEQLNRSRHKLLTALDDISYGKLSGPVGVYGAINPDVEIKALNLLGLKPEPVATQIVPRDRHLSVVMSLSYTAAALERIALQIRLLQRTEIGEFTEPFRKGQKGSSAMPHKRNPIICERICGLARIFRGHLVEAMENVSLWDERDISHSSVERILFPQSTSILLYLIRLSEQVIKDMEINLTSIKQNIELSNHRYLSGPLLLNLCSRGMERDNAYRLVQQIAMQAQQQQTSFAQAAKENKTVRSILNNEDIEKLTADDEIKKYVEIIFNRVLTKEEDDVFSK